MSSDLLEILNQKFEISATALKPFGRVWRVHSAKGCFALKRTAGPAEQLVRTAETLSRIKECGFLSLTLPEISLDNSPYFQFKDRYYQLYKWHEGIHPSFTDPDSIQESARLFGSLHRSSAAIIKPEDPEPPDLVASFKQRTTFLESTVTLLKNYHKINRVDRTFLNWSDYFLTQARYSLSGLVNAEQTLISGSLKGFCHNDPATRNIIIENNDWFLIDFELSAWGLSITELAKLTGRVLQANSWRPEIFDLVVGAYSREKNLTEWEKTVLPYLLCFPQHFWRILNQRWEEKLKWSERRFAARLWAIIDSERQRLLFLKSCLPELPTF